jgi:hypothetical protein
LALHKQAHSGYTTTKRRSAGLVASPDMVRLDLEPTENTVVFPNLA